MYKIQVKSKKIINLRMFIIYVQYKFVKCKLLLFYKIDVWIFWYESGEETNTYKLCFMASSFQHYDVDVSSFSKELYVDVDVSSFSKVLYVA